MGIHQGWAIHQVWVSVPKFLEHNEVGVLLDELCTPEPVGAAAGAAAGAARRGAAPAPDDDDDDDDD